MSLKALLDLREIARARLLEANAAYDDAQNAYDSARAALCFKESPPPVGMRVVHIRWPRAGEVVPLTFEAKDDTVQVRWDALREDGTHFEGTPFFDELMPESALD